MSTISAAHLTTVAVRAAPRTIVLVGPLPPPSGGMANQTRQLAALLASEGCQVEVVRNNADYRPAWIGRVRGVRAIGRLLPFVARLWRSVRGADVVHVMANSGWAWHFFAAPAIWIGWLRGAAVVVNYRGGDAERFLARQVALVRPTLARARLVVVPSGFLAAIFARHGIDTVIVPNIVDLEAFQPARMLPEAPHIVVTRNLEPLYDIGTAIHAFAQVRARHAEARMTIAGSGPERDNLERLATSLGVKDAVHFTGRLDNADVPPLYRCASIVLNPSRVDNMPISVLEALASGVPVVSTDVGGVPHLVEHRRTALLVPPGDADAMAGALTALIEDRALCAELRAAGLERVRCFAWSSVRPLLLAAYARARGDVLTCAEPR